MRSKTVEMIGKIKSLLTEETGYLTAKQLGKKCNLCPGSIHIDARNGEGTRTAVARLGLRAEIPDGAHRREAEAHREAEETAGEEGRA